jgi:hypothetical protein
MTVAPVITTVAGNGTACASPGNTCGDGMAATSANLNNAQHVSVDSAGNLYISDNTDNRIRKVWAASGLITTVAGNGTACASPTASCGDGGAATSANLNYPNAAIVDSAGNLYIADRYDNRIRKVSASTGNISTIAGTGATCTTPTASPACGDGGPATSATFNVPIDLALDGAGNLYIADDGDDRVRMVSASTGNISTVAGNGSYCTTNCGDGSAATSAGFANVRGIAIDRAGNLYISDYENNRIRIVSASTGIISGFAGNGTQCATPANGVACGDGSAAINANLNKPSNLALDLAGNLYIEDYVDVRVRKVAAATSIISTVAGDGTSCAASTDSCGDGSIATEANLDGPSGLALDSSGNLYIADDYDNRIRKVTASAAIVSLPFTSLLTSSAAQNVSLATTATETISSIGVPTSQGGHQEYSIGAITGCTVGSSNPIGTICVLPVTFKPAYPGNRPVPLQVVTSTGNISFTLTGTGSGPLAALIPGVIATAAGTGAVCSAPTASPACGDTGAAAAATLSAPASMVVDSIGNVWVADTGNNRIRKFAVNGTITTVAGTGTACSSPVSACGDGGLATASGAYLNSPRGVYVDGAGNLYIADYGDNRIREVAAGTQIITTVAGTGTACSSPTSTCGDGGAATSAQLNGPVQLAMDGQGDLYIADKADNRIRMVGASTGLLTTVAGMGTACSSPTKGCGDGASALLANLNSPSGLFADGANNLFIADTTDNRVRKVQALNTGSGSGYITTVAGSGTACSGGAAACGDGAAATAASLNSPRALYVDSAGNIYIADMNDNRIRKVTAGSGYISTVSGNGTAGFLADSVAATAAELNLPQGIGLDGAGNLYIADTANNRIRAVDPTQSILTFPTSTPVGISDGTDDPETALVSNIGNAALTIPPPGSGTNPSLATYFALDAATTCAELSTASSAATLASGSDCKYAVDFEPTVAGAVNGSLVLTDNSLNATGTQQTIHLFATATAANTTTTLSSSANPSAFGASVTITATVAPTAGTALPLGTVQFSVNGTAAGSAVTLNSSGQAASTISTLATGTDSITAVYTSTSGNFIGSTATALNQVISKASPSATISWAQPAGIAYGTALSATQLNATSTLPGAFVYSPAAGTVLGIGSHTLSVTFTPTDTTDYTTGSATVTLAVGDATPTTTLTLSASTLAHGLPLTLTATVATGATPIYPGTVTFCDASYSKCLYQAVAGRAQLTRSGTASIKIVPGIGPHTYKAVFGGNTDYAISASAAAAVTVTGTYTTATTISSSGSAGAYTLTGTVVSSGSESISPGGTVAFEDNSNASYVLGSSTLGASVVAQSFVKPGSSSSASVPRDVVTADFNGDGIPDLAIANQTSQTVDILLGNGNGTFTAAPGSPVSVPGTALVGIAVGDFNNDGNVDIAVTDYSANTVSILLGKGDGTFHAAVAISVSGGPEEIAAADFNNDGNLDLVIAEYSGNKVLVLLGDGTGAFPSSSTWTTGTGPYSLAVADLNGDGNLDIVAGNSGQSSVTVLLGDGTGSFSQPSGSPFAAGTNPSAVVAGDFNGDGKPDLAVPDKGGTTVAILLGNGNGTFGAPSYLTALTGQKSIAMADFNEDGYLDLAVCDTSTGTVDIYAGNGNGTFQTAVANSSGSTACSYLATADFNGDGNPDLVAPLQGNNTAAILLDSISRTATASVSALSIPGTGTHNIAAVYLGDTYDASGTSGSIPLAASKATTSLSLQTSPNPSAFGQQVTLTATLSPYSAGALTTNGETVTFKNAGTAIGTGTLSGGVATFNTASLAIGSNSLTAVFPTDTNFLASTSSAVTQTVTKATPTITWATPAAITYGTALSGAQLDATTGGVAGTLIYTPAAGQVLAAGSQALSVAFTPTDTTDYNTASGSVTLTVNKATPTLTVATSGTPAAYGSAVTFTATVSSGPTGTVTFYDSGVAIGTGTIAGSAATFTTTSLTAGSHTITAGWAGGGNYNSVTSSAISQVVNKATPVISWTTPSPITYGMALSAEQLDASSGGVAGTFAYLPVAGTVLGVGSQTLSVTFTPTDTSDYNAAAGSVTLIVNDKVTPAITWVTPSPITYGTALSSTQLNASSGAVAGTMVYSPAAGAVLGGGAQTLQVTFTPTDAVDYNTVIQTVVLTVNRSPVVITGTSSPGPSVFGDTVQITFTFTGGGVTPTGTATINDGEVTLATVSLSGGVATFFTSLLSSGPHTLKAIYNGDDNYQ